jgi:integrase
MKNVQQAREILKVLKLKARGPWYHVEGKNTMGVKVPRHTLQIAVYDKDGKIDKVTKKVAEAKVLELERVTEWPPRKVEAPKEDRGLKLIDAYNLWLGQYREGSSTREAYSAVEKILVAPLTDEGVAFIKDVSSERLRALQASWAKQHKLKTIQNRRSYTSCFFNYCVKYHDLAKNPWGPVDSIKEKKLTREDIMAGKSRDTGIATLPLDLKGNANWLRIQEAIPAFVRFELPGQKIRRGNPLLLHPETFITMLWLMYETGLRRSDALIFRPDWIVNTRHGGRYSTTQVKTGDEVVCFLPQPLVDRLRALPLLKWRGDPSVPGAGMYPFYDGSRGGNHHNYLKDNLDTPLRELGQLLFGKDAPSLRAHRFRDSFAVNQLNMGLSLEDLRRMLGHRSVTTTEKYYAPYVLGMQEAVMNRQAAARQAALFAEAEESARLVSVN